MAGRELFIFLFAFGLVLFDWPALLIFRDSLPVSLFACWGLFIAALGFLSSRIASRRG